MPPPTMGIVELAGLENTTWPNDLPPKSHGVPGVPVKVNVALLIEAVRLAGFVKSSRLTIETALVPSVKDRTDVEFEMNE